MSIELRLKDYLRLPEAEAVNIPSRFPIDQIVEACADGRPDDLQQFQCLIQRNAYGQESLDVLALRDIGLRWVGDLNSVSPADWPGTLQRWLRLVCDAKRREESARQAEVTLLALAEVAKRLARDKEAAEQAKQIEAEGDRRRVDDWSKWLAAGQGNALERENQHDRRLAGAVVALMEERGFEVATKPVQEEAAKGEVNGKIHYVSKATVVERLKTYCPTIKSILENVSAKQYYWLQPAKAPDRGWNFTLLVELLEERGLLTPSAVETIRAIREAGAANWGVQFASQFGQRR